MKTHLSKAMETFLAGYPADKAHLESILRRIHNQAVSQCAAEALFRDAAHTERGYSSGRVALYTRIRGLRK
jgi:hypothetical protein